MSTVLSYDGDIQNPDARRQEAFSMKGYFTAQGFYGLVSGQYMLFSCESDYFDLFSDAD